jgi:hypothetical protein
VELDFHYDYHDATWVKLNLMNNNKMLIINNCCSPRNSDENNERLCNMIRNASGIMKYSHIVITGDLIYQI